MVKSSLVFVNVAQTMILPIKVISNQSSHENGSPFYPPPPPKKKNHDHGLFLFLVDTAVKTLRELKESLKDYSQTLLDFSVALSRQDTCNLSSLSSGVCARGKNRDKNEGNFYVDFGTALFFNSDMFTKQELVVQTVTNICVAPDCANSSFLLVKLMHLCLKSKIFHKFDIWCVKF